MFLRLHICKDNQKPHLSRRRQVILSGPFHLILKFAVIISVVLHKASIFVLQRELYVGFLL